MRKKIERRRKLLERRRRGDVVAEFLKSALDDLKDLADACKRVFERHKGKDWWIVSLTLDDGPISGAEGYRNFEDYEEDDILSFSRASKAVRGVINYLKVSFKDALKRLDDEEYYDSLLTELEDYGFCVYDVDWEVDIGEGYIYIRVDFIEYGSEFEGLVELRVDEE